ncbi:hypothetical protein GCM10010466_18000 [Planomonospora alba]|uniref:FAD-binding domain-containing protein n=1 Tax=Planomonospora alba TaxID=161354 RepID=A0ABP6MVU3_9ACTN
MAALAPALRDRVEQIDGWEAVHRSTVRVDRLPRWHRPGRLRIGDAARAMSPAGGVGIDLAVQDAVATASCWARFSPGAASPRKPIWPGCGRAGSTPRG